MWHFCSCMLAYPILAHMYFVYRSQQVKVKIKIKKIRTAKEETYLFTNDIKI